MHTVTALTLSRLNVSAKSASSWRSTLNPNRVNRCSRWLSATLTDGLDEVEANWRVTPSSNTRPQSSQDSTDHCIAHTYSSLCDNTTVIWRLTLRYSARELKEPLPVSR